MGHAGSGGGMILWLLHVAGVVETAWRGMAWQQREIAWHGAFWAELFCPYTALHHCTPPSNRCLALPHFNLISCPPFSLLSLPPSSVCAWAGRVSTRLAAFLALLLWDLTNVNVRLAMAVSMHAAAFAFYGMSSI